MRIHQNTSSLNDFYRNFTHAVTEMEDRGAKFHFKSIADWEASNNPNIAAGSDEAYDAGHDAFLAELFISNATKYDFLTFKDHLRRSVLHNKKVVPKTIQEAHTLHSKREHEPFYC